MTRWRCALQGHSVAAARLCVVSAALATRARLHRRRLVLRRDCAQSAGSVLQARARAATAAPVTSAQHLAPRTRLSRCVLLDRSVAAAHRHVACVTPATRVPLGQRRRTQRQHCAQSVDSASLAL
jgi:hypothetical protein